MQHEPVKLSADRIADQADQLRHIKRLHAVRCDVNRAMTRRSGRQEFLREFCRILVEVGEFRFSWFGVPDAGGGTCPEATHGDIPEGLKIPSSLLTPWRSYPSDLGSHAVAGFPVQLPSGETGALVVSMSTTDFFSAAVVTLLAELSADIGYALEFINMKARIDTVEETLERERSLFGTLVSTIPDLVWLKDQDGLYLHCNPAFECFFGAMREEIVGRSDYDFVDAELAAFFRMKDREALAADGPTKNEEWVTFADDGHKALLETVKTPLRDGSGRLVGILGIARDVTESRRMVELEASRTMDSRFRVIFDSATEGIVVADTEDLSLLMVNPAACALFGYTEEEFLRLGASDMHPANQLPAVMSEFATLVSGEKTGLANIPCLRRDGAIFAADVGSGRISLGGRSYLLGFFSDITNRLRAEEELRDSEQKFRTFSAMAKDGIVMLDGGGRVTFWNHAAEDIFGFSNDEAIGHYLHPLIVPPDQGDYYLRGLEQFARTGTGPLIDKTYEYRARHKNGEEFPAEVSISGYQLGGRWQAVGIIRDITRRKQEEAALREQAERLRMEQESLSGIIFGANLGTWEMNVRSGAGVLNERWAEMIGYTLAELEPTGLHTLREHTHPDDFKRALDCFGRHINGESRSYECEFRMRHKEGHWVWVSDRGKIVSRDADGRPLLASGTHMDISKRKKAEELLAASEQSLSDIISGAHLGTWEWNLQSGAAKFNERWADMIGYTLAELEPEKLHTLKKHTHPDDLPHALELFDRHLHGELENYECEYRMRHRDGQWVWVLDRGRVITRDADGRPLLASGTHLDITELKQVQLQLEKVNRELAQRTVEAEAANRAKSEFLANMSHEIRTPMNAVIGLGNLALRTESSSKRDDYLTKMTTAAKGLQQLLTDLLDFSKIEAGKLKLVEIPFLLSPLVQQLVDLMEGNADEGGIELTLTVAPDTPDCLVGDSLRLKQVLVNLIGNAIKFTERGYVRVEIRPTPSFGEEVVLEFTVRDSGIGMTPEQLAGIFEPFTQGDSTITRTYGGTGLGLSICRRLVHLMGGEIRASSRVGEGSSFTFTARFRRGAPALVDEGMLPERFVAIQPSTNLPTVRVDLERVGETDNSDGVAGAGGWVDQAAVASLLNRLQGLLQKNSAQAKTLLSPLHDLLRGTVLEADFRRIKASLAKFDFRQARSLAENLAASLESGAVKRGS